MDWFRKAKRGLTPQKKKNIPPVWKKCNRCGQIFYEKELERKLWVCDKCNYHFPIRYYRYIQLLFDEGKWQEHDAGLWPTDPLQFKEKRYAEYLKDYQKRTGMADAAISGSGLIGAIPVIFTIIDPVFIVGSMGSVVGEKVARAIRRALDQRKPLLTINASGGARMQEGILSLMQMAKTGVLLAELGAHGIPYISILTNPTYGGVTASFASLGDLILAEPGAKIGFAGPDVIKQGLGEELPEGFQQAEFLLEHGFIDMVVARGDLRNTLIRLLHFFCADAQRPSTNHFQNNRL